MTGIHHYESDVLTTSPSRPSNFILYMSLLYFKHHVRKTNKKVTCQW